MGVAYKSNLPGICHGVEIFSVGEFNDRVWTLDDLLEIAENTPRLVEQGILSPPLIVIGHDKDPANEEFTQSLLQRTDLPKTGDVRNIVVVGDPRMERCGHWLANPACQECKVYALMLADFLNVDPGIADLINRRAYDRVSSEIWDPLIYDGVDYGVCLKAVSLLGGKMPAVKSLADIPMAVPMGTQKNFSSEGKGRPRGVKVQDAPPSRKSRSVLFCFSERSAMTREEMIAKLQELGVDTSMVTDAVPDAFLAECIRIASEGGAGGAEGGTPPEEQNPVESADCSREKMMAELEGKSDEELKAMLGKGGGESQMSQHADQGRRSKAQIAIDNRIARSEARLRALDRTTAKRLRDEKKAGFAAFSDKLKSQGVPPAVFDVVKGRPSIEEFYLSLDESNVAMFSDGGQKKSQLDVFRDLLEGFVPHVKFSQRLNGKPKGSGTSADEEESRLKSHYAAHADDFSKSGTTQTLFVDAFKKHKKRNPEYTVEEYLST